MASIASIADPVLRLHRRTASGILEPIPTDHDALDVLLAWSPDGTRLLGLRSNQQDLYAFHIFDTESGDITPITGPNGEAMLDLTEFISDPGWIDNNRILHWDDANDSFFVFNLATKTAAYIESPVTNSSGIIDIPDGTTIYFTQQVLNSDLWLIELDNAPTD